MRNFIRPFLPMLVVALVVVIARPIAQTTSASLELLWQYDTAG